MTEAWSERIARRYGCRLSIELADWFDSQIWKQQGLSEFRQSISPESLIARAPDEIWPGMMGSDCLPILSNTAGDWLCVCIDQDNTAAQIIHWYHGGGDWIPWGNNLAEAIAFDAVADRFPSHEKRHAVAPESTRVTRSGDFRANDPYTRWAFDHLPSDIVRTIEAPASDLETTNVFLDNHVAEIATRCELSVSAVMNSIQDWDTAASYAEPVTRLAPELAWAWETIAYAAEHRGDSVAAKDAYLQAVHCSAFTDQSVRLTTHRTVGQTAKFSAARLLSLDINLVESSPYLRILCDEDEQERRKQVSKHWLSIGHQQQQHGDHAAAFDSYVAAGWDIGMTPIESFGTLLDSISEAADESSQTSRAKIARTHRQCLRARFKI